jgi:hypothetical protein
VNVDDLNVEAIDGNVKKLLIQKLSDKLDNANAEMCEMTEWFSMNSLLMNKKCDKCLEISSTTLDHSSIQKEPQIAEMLQWIYEISQIFNLQYQRFQLACHQMYKITEAGGDEAIDEEEDESDRIFHHNNIPVQLSTKPLDGFAFSSQEKELIDCKFKIIKSRLNLLKEGGVHRPI